jgi:hypothetical protein
LERIAVDVAYRIIHKAQKYGVPGATSFLAAAPPERFRRWLARVPTTSKIGDPVLVFVRDPENWSFLATGGIGGFTAGEYREIAYPQIADIQGFPPDNVPLRKRELTSLSVSTEEGAVDFETSPGEDLFALWNLLRKISWPLRK